VWKSILSIDCASACSGRPASAAHIGLALIGEQEGLVRTVVTVE
jgi:hypothetical protein